MMDRLQMRNNRSMPKSVIIPEIPYPDVSEAADWLCSNFGFVERLRIGNHRVQLTFNQGDLVVTAAGSAPIARCSVMIRLTNIADHYADSVRRGVKIINPLADYPYGERQYTAEDFAGHYWTFSETIEDVNPRDWGGIVSNKNP